MDKPLHVQVAEALGWTVFDLRHACGEAPEGTLGLERCVYENNLGNFFAIPAYDTDWNAGGQLVERFGITVGQDGEGVREYWIATETPPWWFFHGHEFKQPTGKGDTPLIAVCNLILALKAAGKLDAAPPRTARPTAENATIVVDSTTANLIANDRVVLVDSENPDIARFAEAARRKT